MGFPCHMTNNNATKATQAYEKVAERGKVPCQHLRPL